LYKSGCRAYGRQGQFRRHDGRDILTDQEPLAAFICPNAHVFLVRECDSAHSHSIATREQNAAETTVTTIRNNERTQLYLQIVAEKDPVKLNELAARLDDVSAKTAACRSHASTLRKIFQGLRKRVHNKDAA
jgi:hypothetical protein